TDELLEPCHWCGPGRHFRRRQLIELAREVSKLGVGSGASEAPNPQDPEPFGWHSCAQVRVACPREARLRPPDAEASMAAVLGAPGQHDAIGEVLAQHIVDERRWQLAGPARALQTSPKYRQLSGSTGSTCRSIRF